jgi:hypothetical protein
MASPSSRVRPVGNGFAAAACAAWCVLAFAAGTAAADDRADTALKWTPHRAALAAAPATGGSPAQPAGMTTPPSARDAAAPPAGGSLPQPVAGTSPQPAGVASITLPPTVPSAGPPPADRTARRRPTADAGPLRGSLGSTLPRFRLPTPPAGGPVAGRSPPPLVGPGAAPAQRPERLAMNANGIPSVMVRRQPNRAADDMPPETVPAPARSAPERVYDDGGPMIMEMGPGETPDGMPPGGMWPDDARGDVVFDDGSSGMTGMPAYGMPRGGMASGGLPYDGMDSDGFHPGVDMRSMSGGMLLGGYPPEMHVESFYDDPYACEGEGAPCFEHDGRFCAWLRRFGRPYYGWRWYRDFTASVGVMSFTNAADLGLAGNFGTNEFLNLGMPLWNAFGIGWQVGVRGTQSNFQSVVLETPTGRLQTPDRQQLFLTTGFYTRAFQGRGLQGGIVWDHLNESFYDDVDVSQLRAEISYVWGYHEVGFWSATNVNFEPALLSPVTQTSSTATTLDLYAAFYRVQFGDANEWKIWGGSTGFGDGLVGSSLRAPIGRSWALDGTFTYIIPRKSFVFPVDGAGTTLSYSPAAWNIGLNMVYYPAARARRSLASPYRPLFEVADNGNMIRKIIPPAAP